MIAFDPGSADLAPPEQQKLDKLAEALAKRPNVKLLVHPAVSVERTRRHCARWPRGGSCSRAWA